MRLPFAQIDTFQHPAPKQVVDAFFLHITQCSCTITPRGGLSDLHEDVLVGGVRRLRGGALARVAFAPNLGPRELAIEFVVEGRCFDAEMWVDLLDQKFE